jgi:ATP-dependent Clp protease adapter protein ClpS
MKIVSPLEKRDQDMNKNYSGTNSNSEEQNSKKQFPQADARLILYNDDVNEFSYVIKCITDILNCDDQQAEQLTILAHYKGSITIKVGTTDSLSQLSEILKEKGLKSAILQNDQK